MIPVQASLFAPAFRIMDLHSQNNTDDSLRPQPPVVRMTQGEAQAVIRLWQQEQADHGLGLTTRPSLADLAEGLEITSEDARRLLAQVRGAQTSGDVQTARIGREHRKFARRIVWGTAVAALGALLLHFLH